MTRTLTRHLVFLAAFAAMFLSAAAQQPWVAGRLTFTAPAAIANIETDDAKELPARLAWSPDGSEVYFQTVEGAFGKPGAKLRHYMISAATGKARDVQAEPEWAAQYWTAKSAQTSPDDTVLKIEPKSEQRTERATSVPMGGDLARGGVTESTGSSAGEGVAAAFNSQTTFINTLHLKGEVIGVFDNTVIVPGLTFGWGPKGSKVIAFTARNSGRVVAMDAGGAKHEVAGSKDAVLPAWAPDGSKLAWLQKTGRKNFVLHVTRVSSS